MNDEKQDFEQLTKLLALKKYEQPPPRYFNEFPDDVISRIRGERGVNASAIGRLNSEAPWLVHFWQALVEKPSFAWAFGAAVCALFMGGVLFVEKPTTQPVFAVTEQKDGNALQLNGSTVGVAGLNQPLLMTSSNSGAVTGPTLFDLPTPVQTKEASFVRP